jgi:hypothetical protein
LLSSDAGCPDAGWQAMKRRIEAAELECSMALAALLSRVDHEAGPR